MNIRFLLLSVVLLAAAVLAFSGGCRDTNFPNSGHSAGVSKADIEELAFQLGVTPDQLVIDQWANKWILWEVRSLGGKGVGWVATSSGHVTDFNLETSGFGLMAPRAGTYQPERQTPDDRSKRLAEMAARRLWLADAMQAKVIILKVKTGDGPNFLMGDHQEYATVDVAIDRGRAPYPTRASMFFNLQSGQCFGLLTERWQRTPK